MPDDTTQRDIGRIEGKLDALIAAVKEQGQQSHDSRRALYERVGKIETSIEISGKIDAQVRERLDGIDERIESEVMPVVAEYRHLKSVGIGMLALAGIAGGAFIGAVIWVWQHIRWPWEGGP